MRHFFDQVLNPSSQVPAAGVQVAVYPHGSGTLATVYADQGSVVKANPLITDSTGSYDFYVADGRYDINISGANIIPKTLSDISIFDFQTGAFVNAALFPGNDIGAQANAAAASISATGGTVFIPAGTWPMSTTIQGANNITFMGAGLDTTILTSVGGSLGTNPIFNFVGSSGTHLVNLRVNGMTLRNGTADSTNYMVGQNGIFAVFVDGLEIDHVKLTEIQGPYAIYAKQCTKLSIHDNQILRWTYAAIGLQNDNQYVYIDKNYLDTCTCIPANGGNCPNTYAIASGSDNALGVNFTRDLWVTRNTVLNNPHWEGLDAHGGENLHFLYNHIENVNKCVNAPLAGGFVSNTVLKNVHIVGNTCIQGTGDPDAPAINVQGLVNVNPATHIEIRENKIIGFGAVDANGVDTVGTVGSTGGWTLHGVIENNEINSYGQSAILFGSWNQDWLIAGNRANDLAGAKNTATSAFFTDRSTGNYGFTLRDNTLDATSAAGIPAAFVNSGDGTLARGGYLFQNNTLKVSPTVAIYRNGAFFPVNRSTIPTTMLAARFGDPVLTTQGQVGWTVNSPSSGYGSLDTTDVVVNGNATSGSAVFVITSNGSVNGNSSDYRYIPLGMNVAIAGAGVAATTLNAKVIANDGTNLTLDTAASTTPANPTTLKYQALTLAALQVDGSGNVSANKYTSTVATGTAPLVVSSTTNIPNLNASSLNGATFAAPGAIGNTTPATGLTLGTGGAALGLIKKLTDTPGAITVNANTCTDRTVADAGILATAGVVLSAAYALDAGIVIGPGFADNGGGNAHYRICNSTVGNITLNAAAAFNLIIIQ